MERIMFIWYQSASSPDGVECSHFAGVCCLSGVCCKEEK